MSWPTRPRAPPVSASPKLVSLATPDFFAWVLEIKLRSLELQGKEFLVSAALLVESPISTSHLVMGMQKLERYITLSVFLNMGS